MQYLWCISIYCFIVLTEEEIYQRFIEFGEINFVSLQTKKGYFYAVVRFKSKIAAKRATEIESIDGQKTVLVVPYEKQ